MLNHSRPIVRKKVLLVLYKVFLKYPEGLRLSFSRMKDRLEDPDPCMSLPSRSGCLALDHHLGPSEIDMLLTLIPACL